MNPIRKLRIESLLQRTITEIINKGFGAVAAVSSVEIAENSRSALVSLYISSDTLDIHSIGSYIKTKIGNSIRLRSTPKLTFVSIKSSLDDL